MYIQLVRPGDSATSEPVNFRYKPCHHNNVNSNRKRVRVSSFYDSDGPLVVEEHSNFYQTTDDYVPQSNSVINENDDIEKLLANLDELNNLEFNAEGIVFTHAIESFGLLLFYEMIKCAFFFICFWF